MKTARLNLLAILPLLLVLFVLVPPTNAYDTEGCLACHQYRGLSRVSDDGKNIELFYVDPNYYNTPRGPHSRLKCTDCHIRKEVEVFPHKPQTPVDCTKTCHLDGPNQVEVRFSHDRVNQMLAGSVHGEKKLDESNMLLGRPLAAGLSQCLLCHDEPSYSTDERAYLEAEAPISRCNTCHDEQLGVDTRQFYWHVTARTKPARSNPDMVRLCAMCHSNPAIRAKYNMPDAAVSYLASFHGKASMLGSEETANCLNCHAGLGRNVHEILAHTQATSPANIANLPDTCRQPACHRAAGASISTAAVHLDLSHGWGVESFIAILFIVLIVFTFGPSLLMTALKMLEIATGRKDPNEHAHIELAKKLLADPATHEKLIRFNVHQRLQHWTLAICFITLVITGFPMKFADSAWAAWLIGELGGIASARQIHHLAGALLIIGLFYHAVYIVLTLMKQRRTAGKSWLRALFDLPMWVGPDDLKYMNSMMLYLLRLKKEHPAGGRFNAEEKFEYIGVFWGSIVLGSTGMLMWFSAWTTQYLPGRILTIAVLIHTMEAFLALLHVGIVHMVSVIFSPAVAPISPAMFNGETPVSELAEAHTDMLHGMTNPGEAAHA